MFKHQQMTKSPMQQLIEWASNDFNWMASTQEDKIKKMKSLLEEEKEAIKAAYIEGFYSGCDQPMFGTMPEIYYQSTYQNSSKI